MSRWLGRFFFGSFIAGCIILGAATFVFLHFMDTPLQAPKLFVIEKGWSITQIANQLESQDVVSSAILFRLLIYATDYQHLNLFPGEYQFEVGDTPTTILTTLQQHKVVRHKFSFPEGLTVQEIMARMQAQGWSDANVLLQDEKLLKKLAIPAPSLEGWLFPETYIYTRGESTLEMVTRMTRMTHKMLDQEWAKRDAEVTLTLLQALTLASIIEKETGQGSERKRISGVFHNRLRQKMRLESDPTVIYGIPDFDGNITRKHLQTPTPFNTYTIFGLPPTPICNPGLASIQAALHPDKSEELFFVAKGDGTHLFSKSYKEHRQYVKQFQIDRKKNAAQE